MTEIRINITTGGDGQVTIVACGLLDLTNAGELQDSLRTAASDADAVIVDLQAAKFIDTAVVQYLANAATTLIDRGKRLKVVVCEKSHPRKVLEIVGFDHIMDIETGTCSE